ncbi:hypothetical protein [Vibrio crassostreae]|uniref:hypothetical protein n=1 Tax=Vibrio crassostreae TaxID=246167 RepID=UPI001B30CC54|nr:hypothetical protein [Vibrio crassostreae]
MMIGHSKQILQDFFQGQNNITPNSQWSEKVIASQSQLENDYPIKYLVGYPQGSEPSFYVLCDSEELMEHTKDWLNCALSRYYCQYARPHKKAEYDFETVLMRHWPHGFLKVSVWGRTNLSMDQATYRTFLPQAMKQSQEALDKMIMRYQSSPVINRQSSKPIGMLVKSFIDAYNKQDHKSMVENYDLIVISEDIERRNKDTLKFMLLEVDEEWGQIIELAHKRNVSAQIVSSGVSVAIMNAVFSLSATNAESINSFDIDWPSMYERAVEFLPILTKKPLFDVEYHWKLWAVLVYLFNIEGGLDVVKSHLDETWLHTLTQQDISVNAIPLNVEERLDLSTVSEDMQSVLFVLNYAQTCHENELLEVYEWLESISPTLRMKLKQDCLYHRLWSKLEESALAQSRIHANV